MTLDRKTDASTDEARLFSDPLGWWYAEHERQRELFSRFELLALAPDFDAALTERLLVFLREDFPNHIQEEEREWFPRLRMRARPDDDFANILTTVTKDHKEELIEMAKLFDPLQALCTAKSPLSQEQELSRAISDLAKRERQHLAIENAIILPIARLRLTPEDRLAVSHAIALRRGYTPPMDLTE